MHTCTCRHPLAHDPATSHGLVYGYFGGAVKLDGDWALVPAGTATLFNDAINYVELDPTTATINVSTFGFDASRIPMAKVSTIDGEITGVVDWRPAFIPGERGEPGVPGVDGENGTNGTDGTNGVDGTNGTNGTNGEPGPMAIIHGNGEPVDGETGVDDPRRMYLDDEAGMLYLNQGTLAVPAWFGVLNSSTN